jgi:hypothetical protein
MKTLESAETSVTLLPDGRAKYAIKHELLRGVKPGMIVWYLNHMTDDYVINGQTVQRYRIWHPRDHIRMMYVRPAKDGQNFGAGALVHIQEAFNANPKHKIDIKAHVEFLDETGFAHFEKMCGVRVARVDYTFTDTGEGTLYENALTVGLAGDGVFSRWFNRTLVPRVFPEEKGRAWLVHNIEEVGNFEFFLPDMFADEGANTN